MQPVPADGKQRNTSNIRAFFPKVIWIIMRSASLRAQEKWGYVVQVHLVSQYQRQLTETSLGSSSRTVKIVDSAWLLISPACLFICQGKKMHTVNNSFRHPVSQWWIINNVQRHWKYVEVYTVSCRGTSRRFGALGYYEGSWVLPGCIMGNLTCVFTIIVQINTAAAETYTYSAFTLI